MTSKMRRASIETLERIVKDATASQAEASRDRRLSLTMMNCIWARNTDVETIEPVQGVLSGRSSLMTALSSRQLSDGVKAALLSPPLLIISS